jgi:superfamily II DNA/RNA helicase
MGFYDDIMQIAKQLPADRQTLMFSATMPPKIRRLAGEILRDPKEIKIAVSRPADGIDQSAYVCHENQKTPILRHLFRTTGGKRVIVFASSKLKVKELARELRRERYNVGEIHSDLDQNTRERVLTDFRGSQIDILVATDIVARGIDIDDIKMVVNYDVPHEAEDYVHRIGRTARAGAEGRAVTFVSPAEQPKFRQIESFLGKEVTKNPIPEGLGDAPAYRRDNNRRDNRRDNNRRGPNRPKQKSAQKPANKSDKPSTPHRDNNNNNNATAAAPRRDKRRKRYYGPRHKSPQKPDSGE